MQPKLTVIVPAYRAGACMSQLIVAWTYQDPVEDFPFEVLIGVDGCPDTLKALEGMTLPAWVRVFWSKTNLGCYNMLNSLVPHARSEYLLFFGADDLPCADLLEQIQKNQHRTDMLALKHHGPNGPQNCHGCFGIAAQSFARMGGYKSWRCAADTEFIRRARRSKLTTYLLPHAMFFRGSSPDQLTKAPETGFGSVVRLAHQAEIDTSIATGAIEVVRHALTEVGK